MKIVLKYMYFLIFNIRYLLSIFLYFSLSYNQAIITVDNSSSSIFYNEGCVRGVQMEIEYEEGAVIIPASYYVSESALLDSNRIRLLLVDNEACIEDLFSYYGGDICYRYYSVG